MNLKKYVYFMIFLKYAGMLYFDPLNLALRDFFYELL